MKIFDYKLILLLALTFVIYFMYRELQTLNKRVDSLESRKDSLNKQLVNQEQPKFIKFNNLENNESTNNLNVNQPEVFVKENQHLQTVKEVKKAIDNILPNESCTISTEEESATENLEKINEENADEVRAEELDEENAVEIYSNDNVESISTQQSSLEELNIQELDKDNVVKNITQVFIDNNEETMDLNNMNLSPTSSIASSISNIEDIDTNNLTESPKKKETESPKKKETESSKKKETENDKIEEISVDLLLKRNKLQDLKDIATKLNIELRTNGKAKTKKQLAQEIFTTKTSQ